jgi:hypothetical protein
MAVAAVLAGEFFRCVGIPAGDSLRSDGDWDAPAFEEMPAIAHGATSILDLPRPGYGGWLMNRPADHEPEVDQEPSDRDQQPSDREEEADRHALENAQQHLQLRIREGWQANQNDDHSGYGSSTAEEHAKDSQDPESCLELSSLLHL